MARGRSSNNLVVPQATAALQQLKMEAARELGVTIPQDGYYGNYTSRETGSWVDILLNVWFNWPSSPSPGLAVHCKFVS